MTPQPAQPTLPDRSSQTPPNRSGSGEIADAVRAAVLAVPGVADLHSGSYGEVATYLPGRKVQGVRVRAERTEVHVVLDWGSPALATADAVRGAAMAITATAVNVHVQDFTAPPGFEPGADDAHTANPVGDQERDQAADQVTPPGGTSVGDGLSSPVADGPGRD